MHRSRAPWMVKPRPVPRTLLEARPICWTRALASPVLISFSSLDELSISYCARCLLWRARPSILFLVINLFNLYFEKVNFFSTASIKTWILYNRFTNVLPFRNAYRKYKPISYSEPHLVCHPQSESWGSTILIQLFPTYLMILLSYCSA